MVEAVGGWEIWENHAVRRHGREAGPDPATMESWLETTYGTHRRILEPGDHCCPTPGFDRRSP